MSVELVARTVPIDSSAVTPTARELRLSANYRATYDELRDALRGANVIAASVHQPETLIGTLFDQVGTTACACLTFWEGRTRKAEHLLRKVLASDALSEDERRAILTTLHGRRGPQRDLHILSDLERAMIDQYRQMAAADRQMIRTLFARLAVTPEQVRA